MENKRQNLFSEEVVSYINGAILFTAPHSKSVIRGGERYNTKVEQVHKKQLFVDYICPQMARWTGYNSFCFWGKSSEINKQQLDPNFLLAEHFKQSPFHLCLHRWMQRVGDAPLLHIDIHGKTDREILQIDIGIKALETLWPKSKLAQQIKQFVTNVMSKVFEGVIFPDDKKVVFECEKGFRGFRKDQFHTMAHQAAMLGIPSFQMELPKSVREKLLQDHLLMEKFCKSINELFGTVIVPWHGLKNHKTTKIDEKLAEKFEPSLQSKFQVDQLLCEIVQHHKN